MASALAEHLPNASVHILRGQRHMAPVEAASEVNTLLIRFLDNVHNHSLQEETLR